MLSKLIEWWWRREVEKIHPFLCKQQNTKSSLLSLFCKAVYRLGDNGVLSHVSSIMGLKMVYMGFSEGLLLRHWPDADLQASALHSPLLQDGECTVL